MMKASQLFWLMSDTIDGQWLMANGSWLMAQSMAWAVLIEACAFQLEGSIWNNIYEAVSCSSWHCGLAL